MADRKLRGPAQKAFLFIIYLANMTLQSITYPHIYLFFFLNNTKIYTALVNYDLLSETCTISKINKNIFCDIRILFCKNDSLKKRLLREILRLSNVFLIVSKEFFLF